MEPTRAVFITGTDTGVGKTRLAAEWVRDLRGRGIRAAGFKPLLCGVDREDAECLLAASDDGDLTVDEVNPCWIRQPIAPIATGERVDVQCILDAWETLRARYEHVVIEGAGGWEMPLSESWTFADLAKKFAVPVVVVAANRLGVLNHTKLTVDAIGRAGLVCSGIVLNEIAPPDPADLARTTNLGALRKLFPIIQVMPHAWGADHFSGIAFNV